METGTAVVSHVCQFRGYFGVEYRAMQSSSRHICRMRRVIFNKTHPSLCLRSSNSSKNRRKKNGLQVHRPMWFGKDGKYMPFPKPEASKNEAGHGKYTGHLLKYSSLDDLHSTCYACSKRGLAWLPTKKRHKKHISKLSYTNTDAPIPDSPTGVKYKDSLRSNCTQMLHSDSRTPDPNKGHDHSPPSVSSSNESNEALGHVIYDFEAYWSGRDQVSLPQCQGPGNDLSGNAKCSLIQNPDSHTVSPHCHSYDKTKDNLDFSGNARSLIPNPDSQTAYIHSQRYDRTKADLDLSGNSRSIIPNPDSQTAYNHSQRYDRTKADLDLSGNSRSIIPNPDSQTVYIHSQSYDRAEHEVTHASVYLDVVCKHQREVDESLMSSLITPKSLGQKKIIGSESNEVTGFFHNLSTSGDVRSATEGLAVSREVSRAVVSPEAAEAAEAEGRRTTVEGYKMGLHGLQDHFPCDDRYWSQLTMDGSNVANPNDTRFSNQVLYQRKHNNNNNLKDHGVNMDFGGHIIEDKCECREREVENEDNHNSPSSWELDIETLILDDDGGLSLTDTSDNEEYCDNNEGCVFVHDDDNNVPNDKTYADKKHLRELSTSINAWSKIEGGHQDNSANNLGIGESKNSAEQTEKNNNIKTSFDKELNFLDQDKFLSLDSFDRENIQPKPIKSPGMTRIKRKHLRRCYVDEAEIHNDELSGSPKSSDKSPIRSKKREARVGLDMFYLHPEMTYNIVAERVVEKYRDRANSDPEKIMKRMKDHNGQFQKDFMERVEERRQSMPQIPRRLDPITSRKLGGNLERPASATDINKQTLNYTGIVNPSLNMTTSKDDPSTLILDVKSTKLANDIGLHSSHKTQTPIYHMVSTVKKGHKKNHSYGHQMVSVSGDKHRPSNSVETTPKSPNFAEISRQRRKSDVYPIRTTRDGTSDL